MDICRPQPALFVLLHRELAACELEVSVTDRAEEGGARKHDVEPLVRSQSSVVAAVVTGARSAASAISDMLSRLRAGKFGALVTMLHSVVPRQSVLL